MSDDDDSPSSEYPPPIIIEPTSEHQESWIILHGRGDKAATFSQGYMGILNMPLPDGRTIQNHLPHVRFVFPTASHRGARVFDHTAITQWFDIYSWNSTERTEWQVDGLKETAAWVDELVRRESEVVGARNVVVGGLSQGCASSLIWNLLWSGESIKCVFGMSGWLPFRHVLETYLPNAKVSGHGEPDRLFERESTDAKDVYKKAVKALCQKLGLDPCEGEVGKSTPIFLGHGVVDGTVDVERGREAAQCLLGLGCNVQWTEYEKLIHWFNGEELLDVVQFVQRLPKPEGSEIVDGETVSGI